MGFLGTCASDCETYPLTSTVKGEVHPKSKISQFVDFEALSSVVKVPSPYDTPFWRYFELEIYHDVMQNDVMRPAHTPSTPCDVKEIQVPGLLAFQ